MDKENNTGDQCINDYVVGDLLWAKIGHYPYWPCMISYEPYEGAYSIKKKVRSSEVIIYHVQYFGKQVQHGWTSPGLIIPFEGEKAYYALRRKLKKQAKSTCFEKKIVAKFDIATGIHEAWIVAVREAEVAMELEAQERYESYVFRYNYNFKKSELNIDASRKSKSKGDSNKPMKAIEMYGTDKRICRICHMGYVDLSCAGICLQYFHKDCLGLLNAPVNFKCIYCERGLGTCFICKKSCRYSPFCCNKCKYYFHEDCLKKFPYVDKGKKICPYHVCHTCCKENRKSKSKGSLISCIRCPTSFHATLHCMPVGSVKLSSSTMVCPNHFLGKNKVSPQVTCNVTYCYVCSEGGELICCESCPHSYHATCINAKIPLGDFYCEDCTKRQYLYVGMIVWAKTGNFRWWPAQIVNADDLPLNVKNMDNYDGEFPVQYFGTDEYYWAHRGRVIPYADHHRDYWRTGLKQCRLNSYFKLSLEEAVEAFNQYVSCRQMQSINERRDAYKHIKINRAIPPAQIATNLASKSVLPCSCNPNRPYPCGESSGCLNRSMLMECHPDVCLAGDRCENQKFQRRNYAKVKVFRTTNRGWGLQTLQFIPKGSFVIEYVGEVITHEEYRKRVVKMQENNEQNYYFLYLDARRMIDAGPQGNFSRFINHACSANCEMSKWSVNGDSRIGIFAIRDIHPGEELTFNYQSDTIQFEQKCYCENEDCQGFIGRNGERLKKKLKSK